MVTSSKRTYAIPKSASTRSPVPVADHRQSVPTQEMLKHRSLGPTVHKVCLSPLSVSGGNVV